MSAIMRGDALSFLKGRWDLVEATFAGPDGSGRMPFGPSPRGFLVIAESGDFSVHVMRAQRRRFAFEHPTTAEKQQVYDDYVSYAGRLEPSKDSDRTLIVRIEVASNPNWVGDEQIRFLDVEDPDHLVVRTAPIDYDETKLVGRLRWRRRPDAP